MLTVKSLSKTYPNGIRALKNVSLEIPKGMFGLVGPNGAGKSTLMQTIATLQESDAGAVSFGELDVLHDKEKVRRILGYLPQEFGVYPKFSAEAMLNHFAVLKGIMSSKERKETVDSLLRTTNLWDIRRQTLGTYSGGMRQRFGIAQALLGNPELVIVDEPTAGLDPEERRRFLGLLSEIGENVVVIISTHIVGDVSELCGRMAIIDEGRVLLDGDPATLVSKLDTKIWQKVVEKNEVESYRNSMEVISTRLKAGRTVIRVYSDVSPHGGFEPVDPDLEDVYFLTLKRSRTNADAAC
jgi:ABC-type multidrug transport system ATPase subunit